METEETLRRRIDTVANLRAIVRTMKALSAVSGRHYEGVLRTLDDYTRTVNMGLHVALRGRVFDQPVRKRAPERLAAVIFGSDVGLCGRFNEELIAHALDKMNGFHVPSTARSVLAVGARIDARLGGRPCKNSAGVVGTEIPAKIEIAGSPRNWFNRG
jgi:F-type H+-transporting ATPase subunit gamma